MGGMGSLYPYNAEPSGYRFRAGLGSIPRCSNEVSPLCAADASSEGGRNPIGFYTPRERPNMWRTSGPCTSNAESYSANLSEEFSRAELCSLADFGGNLIRQVDGM